MAPDKGLPPEHAAAKAEAWLRDNGFTSLPIDPVKVAELLEIPVHPLEQTKPGVSGMLHRAGNQFVIMFGTYIKNPASSVLASHTKSATTCFPVTPSISSHPGSPATPPKPASSPPMSTNRKQTISRQGC